tara:strand:+ start:17531 stop:17821 length:291 start_codon:yes stop_codon:yes gene_type:complete
MTKKQWTVDNISSFLEGNLKWAKSKLIDVPVHIREQLQHRENLCGDCIANEGCIKCGCPPAKKRFVKKSCNLERFPDLMNADEWNEFKKTLDGKDL